MMRHTGASHSHVGSPQDWERLKKQVCHGGHAGQEDAGYKIEQSPHCLQQRAVAEQLWKRIVTLSELTLLQCALLT